MAPAIDNGMDENKKALELIEDVTANAGEVQLRVLTKILSRNAGVEYLQRHGLAGATDRETFKKMVPVVTYDDVKSDIQRIVKGDTSPILCSNPVTEFFISSGTSSGESKFIPTTEDEKQRKFIMQRMIMSVIYHHIPGIEKGKGMYLWSTKPAATTPGGLLAQPIVTSSLRGSQFLNRPTSYYLITSPNETILCPDSFQSLYSQLLCGLLQRHEVVRVGAVFPSHFFSLMNLLKDHWPLLCNDIRTGTLNDQITDMSVREAVSRILRPDQELVDFLERECSKESWEGMVRKLWPNTKYVDVVVTGTMSQYIPNLEYYIDGLPIVCNAFCSSECFFGINLDPLAKPSEVSYTIIPIAGYFEFLPVGIEDGNVNSRRRELVDLVDVELGKEYEIVVTTYAGLYRYRMGDVLRVAGFKNKTPQFSYVCRKNVVLSVGQDNTNEDVLHNAVKTAAKLLEPFGATLLDYTSFSDTHTSPGHYVLFWEVWQGSTHIPPSVFEDCCSTIEESLHSSYRQSRVLESIDPLEIKIVEAGTFEKLMEHATSSGLSVQQYKTPRCVKSAPMVEVLSSRVVGNYFCPKCPKWVV